MSELRQGRPQDDAERLPKELRCYDFLDNLGISYAGVDHPVAETMDACRRVEEILGAKICKNLFLCNRQKTDFYLLLMPGDKPFKTKELSAQLGVARLSFAGPEQMIEYLDITPGSVSVLGLINDKNHKVRLVVDEDIFKEEYFGCHPCINTSSLKLNTKDVFEKILPALNVAYTKVYLVGAMD